MGVVLWDFDETLAFRPGRWAGCLIEVLDEHEPGHAVAIDDIRPGLRDGFPWHRHETPHPDLSADPDSWWQPVEGLIARAYGDVGYPPERAQALAEQARARFTDPSIGWRLFDDTLASLAVLQEAGWRHAILSNHVPELPAIAAHLGLSPSIEAIVNSATTGYEKPHPGAFAAARRALGDPDELWMVGDNPVADFEGATAAGIPAILVRQQPGGTLAAAVDLISRSTAPTRLHG